MSFQKTVYLVYLENAAYSVVQDIDQASHGLLIAS